MKKFYEAPVVELTGFSAEDVITTSAVGPIDAGSMDDTQAAAFKAAVAAKYEVDAANVSVYEW